MATTVMRPSSSRKCPDCVSRVGQWGVHEESKLLARELALAMAEAQLNLGHGVVIPQHLGRTDFIGLCCIEPSRGDLGVARRTSRLARDPICPVQEAARWVVGGSDRPRGLCAIAQCNSALAAAFDELATAI